MCMCIAVCICQHIACILLVSCYNSHIQAIWQFGEYVANTRRYALLSLLLIHTRYQHYIHVIFAYCVDSTAVCTLQVALTCYACSASYVKNLRIYIHHQIYVGTILVLCVSAVYFHPVLVCVLYIGVEYIIYYIFDMREIIVCCVPCASVQN